MTFIRKIRTKWLEFTKYIKHRSFRTSVQQEKRQKYLFRQEIHEKHQSKRADFIFRQKRAVKPLLSVFQKLERDKVAFTGIVWIVGWVLLILSSYIIFISPYFRISPSQVLITPFSVVDDTIIDLDLAYKSVEDIYNKSIFFIEKWTIIESVKKYQKNVKDIEFDRLYPNGLKLILYSYPPHFDTTVFGVEKPFVLTENGTLVPGGKIKRDSFENLEIIDNTLKESSFLDYKQGIPQDYMTGVLYIEKSFLEGMKDAKVAKFRFFKKEHEFHVTLESGTHILLTLDKSLQNQIAFLKAYHWHTKTVLTNWEVKYIDARVPGKIFRCDNPTVCGTNLVNTYGNAYR